MSYFPETMPGVLPNMDDHEFWRFCNERSLHFQSCAQCGRLRHPPNPMCANCQSTDVIWVEAPERAEVYTYTVVHHASHPAVEGRLPYVVAVVTFPGLDGVKLVTNIVDIAPADVRIGMPLSIAWDRISDDMHVPRFRPAGKESA